MRDMEGTGPVDDGNRKREELDPQPALPPPPPEYNHLFGGPDVPSKKQRTDALSTGAIAQSDAETKTSNNARTGEASGSRKRSRDPHIFEERKSRRLAEKRIAKEKERVAREKAEAEAAAKAVVYTLAAKAVKTAEAAARKKKKEERRNRVGSNKRTKKSSQRVKVENKSGRHQAMHAWMNKILWQSHQRISKRLDDMELDVGRQLKELNASVLARGNNLQIENQRFRVTLDTVKSDYFNVILPKHISDVQKLVASIQASERAP